MATAVFVHAHPDDEAIATGGTMVLAAKAGHRVVLVCATDGAVGEADPVHIPEGETLADVRRRETEAAAAVLGVDRLVFLGYRDSGMQGESTNDDPRCFWQADVDEAAQKLADILRDEKADVLTIYDAIGGYHHPDHVQVHQVGIRAAALVDGVEVFESTMHRERMAALVADPAWGDGDDDQREQQRAEFAELELGTPAAEITHAVDVSSVVDIKRQAMAAHRSQIGEDSMFLTLPNDRFTAAFGTEWYVHRGSHVPGEPYRTDLFVGSE
jgi:LmbE family N-acetylglucosaminyl deacetylase